MNKAQMIKSKHRQIRFRRVALTAFVALWIGGHLFSNTVVAQESKTEDLTIGKFVEDTSTLFIACIKHCLPKKDRLSLRDLDEEEDRQKKEALAYVVLVNKAKIKADLVKAARIKAQMKKQSKKKSMKKATKNKSK